MLATGMDPKGVMAELTGRRTGYSHGKGGSMHMFSRDKHFYGGHGIVGAQVPIGTGLGFAHRYKNDGKVSLTYLGDGAINQGQVYESFNMAALWNLPVVYVIENNRYSMGTSLARHSASNDLYVRAAPYGIPGMQVDGRHRRRACAFRGWTLCSRDADLSLPRPLDVRPGEIPLQGRGQPHARR